MIKQCLQAAGITRIIWIDDYFAVPSRDDTIEVTIKTLINLKQLGHKEVPGFGDIKLQQSDSSLTTAVEELLEEKTDKEIDELFNSIKDISPGLNVEEDAQDDLSTAEFTSLRKAFGNSLVTQSLGDWTSQGAEKYSEADEGTLFLIDKEFNRESPTYDGSILVAELASSGNAFCILLTHRCSNEVEENDRRKEISESNKVLFHKFAVLSKRSGDPGEAISKRFARAFSAVMMHRFTGDLAFTIAEAIKKSASDTALKLSKMSVYDLDRAVFVNSSREGVLEFDVLVRIFNSVERGNLNKALCTPKIQKSLRRIRSFSKGTRGLKIFEPPIDSMKDFRQWRKNEIFEAGEALNSMHAPLVCGDVFEIQNAKKQKFVLLGQACDLMIRSKDGERRASLGFLIEVKSLKASLDEEGPQSPSVSTFDLEGVFGADDIWSVNFRSKIIADLNVLDLAVFNQNGDLTLTAPHPEPEIALSEGWERRFKIVKKIYCGANGQLKKLPLCVGTFSEPLKPRIKKGVLTYPLLRVGRLEGNTATAILAAWATFETRAALQHDFAAPDKALQPY